jgi:hypothetical protein
MILVDFQFNYLVNRVVFAATDSSTRLRCILFEPEDENNLRAVATDGVQIAFCTIPFQDAQKFTIPIETVDFLKKHIQYIDSRCFTFSVSDSSVIVKTPNLTLEHPNHAGIFPAWEKVLDGLHFEDALSYTVDILTVLRLIEHAQERVLLPYAEMKFNKTLLSRAFKQWDKRKYWYRPVVFTYSPTEMPAVRFFIREHVSGIGDTCWTYVLAPMN